MIALIKRNKSGATFAVWLLVIGTVFSGLLAVLMSGNTQSYMRGIDFYSRSKVLYMAEAGLAKALTKINNNGIDSVNNMNFEYNGGDINIKIKNTKEGTYIISKASWKHGKIAREERIKAQIKDDSGNIQLTNYYWMGKNEK